MFRTSDIKLFLAGILLAVLVGWSFATYGVPDLSGVVKWIMSDPIYESPGGDT